MVKKKRPFDKVCYVIMPFAKTRACSEEEWTDIFENLITPAVQKAGFGYECVRSEATTGNLIKSIVNSLYDASVVIADLTDRNPNVFYELGVRHTLRNRTILLAQHRKHIPSDLTGYASHVYRWKTAADKVAFRKKLKALLSAIDDDVERPDNPVADFLRDRSVTILDFQRDQSMLMLRALIDEMDVLSSIIFYSRNSEEDASKEYAAAAPTPALDHLIANQYVNNYRFSRFATGLRAQIAIVQDSSVDSDTLASVRDQILRFRENAERIHRAVRSGESVESLDLGPAKPLDSTGRGELHP